MWTVRVQRARKQQSAEARVPCEFSTGVGGTFRGFGEHQRGAVSNVDEGSIWRFWGNPTRRWSWRFQGYTLGVFGLEPVAGKKTPLPNQPHYGPYKGTSNKMCYRIGFIGNLVNIEQICVSTIGTMSLHFYFVICIPHKFLLHWETIKCGKRNMFWTK